MGGALKNYEEKQAGIFYPNTLVSWVDWDHMEFRY